MTAATYTGMERSSGHASPSSGHGAIRASYSGSGNGTTPKISIFPLVGPESGQPRSVTVRSPSSSWPWIGGSHVFTSDRMRLGSDGDLVRGGAQRRSTSGHSRADHPRPRSGEVRPRIASTPSAARPWAWPTSTRTASSTSSPATISTSPPTSSRSRSARSTARVDDAGKGYHDDFMNAPLDVDGDGLPDVVACTWFAKRIAWYRNPASPASSGPKR